MSLVLVACADRKIDLMPEFSDWLRKERKRVNLTGEELAEKVKTSQGTIASYESGIRKPRPDRIREIAAALGSDVNEALAAAGYKPDNLDSDGEIEYVTDPDEVQLLSSYRGVVSEAGKKYALDIIKAMKERDSSESIGKRSSNNGVGEEVRE